MHRSFVAVLLSSSRFSLPPRFFVVLYLLLPPCSEGVPFSLLDLSSCQFLFGLRGQLGEVSGRGNQGKTCAIASVILWVPRVSRDVVSCSIRKQDLSVREAIAYAIGL